MAKQPTALKQFAELKAKLKRAGLSTTGKKATLEKRWRERNKNKTTKKPAAKKPAAKKKKTSAKRPRRHKWGSCGCVVCVARRNKSGGGSRPARSSSKRTLSDIFRWGW